MATATWYNMDYWLVNGLLLKNTHFTALGDLIPWKYENVGEAIREGVKLLLLENAALLAAGAHTLHKSKVKLVQAIVSPDRPQDMKPDGVGSFKVRVLEEMYAKIIKEENS